MRIKSFLFTSIVLFFAFNLSAQNERLYNENQLISDLKTLSSDEFEGREVGTAGGIKAREYLKKRFATCGLKPFGKNYEQEFTSGGKKATNLIGYIPGKRPDVFIVISAHYDHIGVHGKKLYNGADDNASGVSALLAMAKYFSANQPEQSLIFFAPDAEESGLRGAYHFMENSPVPLKKILMNINMDMISRSDKNKLFACGTAHYPALKHFFANDAAETFGVDLELGHDTGSGSNNWTYSSDHGPFHKKGIPFIYFGVEDHADYHKPTDTFEKVDREFYKNVTSYILDFLISADANLGEF